MTHKPFELLGLSTDPQHSLAWHALILNGLPRECVKPMAKVLAVTEKEVFAFVGETGTSRSKEPLSAYASDQMYRLAHVLSVAFNVFKGDTKQALSWMRAPQALLRGRVPMDLIRTPLTTDYVLTALSRI